MMIGRKTLKSERARTRRIDIFFERVIQVFLLSYMLFFVIAWLSYRPALHIQQVVIDGVRGADQSAVSAIVTDPLSWRFIARVNRNNMFFYPREQVLHDLIALDPRMANVKLAFEGTQRIHVTLQEFTPSLLYCTPAQISSDAVNASSTEYDIGDCYFADERGYIYASAPTWSGYPFLTFIASSTEQSTSSPIGTFAIDLEDYTRLREFFTVLAKMDISPRIITILDGNDFLISSANPWDILWSTKKDPQVSADNLALMLRTFEEDPLKAANIRTIDLRFGNKIFYK